MKKVISKIINLTPKEILKNWLYLYLGLSFLGIVFGVVQMAGKESFWSARLTNTPLDYLIMPLIFFIVALIGVPLSLVQIPLQTFIFYFYKRLILREPEITITGLSSCNPVKNLLGTHLPQTFLATTLLIYCIFLFTAISRSSRKEKDRNWYTAAIITTLVTVYSVSSFILFSCP